LNKGVENLPRRRVERAFDVVRGAAAPPTASFSKAAARSGSYLSAYRTINRADSTAAMASDWVSLSAEEGLLLVDAPLPALGPEGHALLVDGPQVAVDGPDRHADPLREVRRPDAVGMGLQDAHQTGHPGQSIAFGTAAVGRLVEGHGAGG
jgi:hypothetical protein